MRLLALPLFGSSLVSCTRPETATPPTATVPETVSDSSTQTNAPPAITQAAVAQIRQTMTLAEIQDLLGSRGQLIEDPETSTDNAQTYEWRNPDGSYLWIVFAEGQIVGMGQVGLPKPSD
jgi:N-acetylmuramoyl-L-alanine amidase CwlA